MIRHNDLERAHNEVVVTYVEPYLLLPEGTDENHEISESESWPPAFNPRPVVVFCYSFLPSRDGSILFSVYSFALFISFRRFCPLSPFFDYGHRL